MSLYLTELKVKTAYELAQSAQSRMNEAAYSKDVQLLQLAYGDLDRLKGILREIIDRPKETANG